jgi:hypothetical protein
MHTLHRLRIKPSTLWCSARVTRHQGVIRLYLRNNKITSFLPLSKTMDEKDKKKKW